MDNSKLDIYLLFHDDPELLEILEDAGAFPEMQAQQPDEPVRPQGREDDGHTGGSKQARPAEPVPRPSFAETASWTNLLQELDNLLNNSAASSKPGLPPPSAASGLAYDEEADSLILQATLDASPPSNEDDPPFVFEKAVPLGSGKQEPPEDENGFPHAYEDQAADVCFDGQSEFPDKAEESLPPSRSKRIANALFSLFFFLLCACMVVGSTIFAFSNDPQKSFLGYRFFNVLSTSMTPHEGSPPGGFHKGDIVVVQMVRDPEQIKIGDIITIRPDTENDTYLTHRVVEILTQENGETGLFFVTRGDANNTDDPPVSSDKVLGKVVLALPRTGVILEYIREKFVFVVAGVLLICGLLLFLALRSRAREKRRHSGRL